MSSLSKIIVLSGLLFLVGAALLAQFIPVQEASLHYSEHTINGGELAQGVLVGQTFVAHEDNLSGIAVKFATYSNRQNTQPVEFHLRHSFSDQEDLRQASVAPSALGDNQLYRFSFKPIAKSAGQTFFFYVVSPRSRVGDAVTVDLDTRDPYHEGSAYILRGVPDRLVEASTIERSGKQTIDVVFGTYHTTSLRAAIVHALQRTVRTIIATWDERQASYLLWLELFAPGLAFCLLLFGLQEKTGATPLLRPKVVSGLLAAIVIGALAIRWLYARQLPITNDEGNYLYDAQALLRGILAGGDGYVKAPLVIAWTALWQLLLGNTVLAGRLGMIVASSFTALPLYFIGKAALNQRAGLLAAAAWAFMGAPVVFGIYVHTQSVALLFGASGLAYLWIGLKQKEPAGKWFILTGLLLGLGVASRKSVLALGLVPLGLVIIESGSWPRPWRGWSDRLRRLLLIGIFFGIVMAGFVGLAIKLYTCDDWLWLVHKNTHCMGAEEALGINSADDGLTPVTAEEVDNVREYSLRGMTPFFRESLPLILLSLLGWGLLLEDTTRRLLKDHQRLLTKLVWLAPAGVGWWAWSFFHEYEGSLFQELGGLRWWWYAGALTLAAVALWPSRDQSEPSQTLNNNQVRALIAASALPVAWLGGLVFFYMHWIKFHANYIGEFLPPLAVMSGVGAYLTEQKIRRVGALGRHLLGGLFVVVLVWSLYLTQYITYTFAHTGTFDQSAVEEAAAWAQQNILLTEPIFTGAAVVPYLSGHRTALDIAHPRWYAYEFTRQDTQRLETFLPPIETMLAAYRKANWLLLEQQTSFSFLMEYTEIEAGLARDWQLVHEVENMSNPLKFYRRVK